MPHSVVLRWWTDKHEIKTKTFAEFVNSIKRNWKQETNHGIMTFSTRISFFRPGATVAAKALVSEARSRWIQEGGDVDDITAVPWIKFNRNLQNLKVKDGVFAYFFAATCNLQHVLYTFVCSQPGYWIQQQKVWSIPWDLDRKCIPTKLVRKKVRTKAIRAIHLKYKIISYLNLFMCF